MKQKIAYYTQELEIDLTGKNVLAVLNPNQLGVESSGANEVIRSINNPIGSKRLKDLVTKNQSVAIITSDITRPLPSYTILPVVLQELNAGGVKNENITIVFALGSHRAHTKEEMIKLVGADIYNKVSCIDSIGDFINVGTTSRNTPIDIFAPVANADVRVCLGNIEYHYFAGYSGGAKAIMPGVSTHAAIQSNHSRMVDASAKAGAILDNPVRLDIEEAAAVVGIDFIVNVVLDEHKNIVKCVSGDCTLAHREGCDYLDKMYKVAIPSRADIVIVSPGGYPKDINLYQAQKALDNAKHAIKDGGIIIWLAHAGEGLGESCFEKWMLGHQKSSDMITHIQKDFQLGGHKAAAIAMVLEHAKIMLVSALPPDFVRSIHLDPYDSIDQALTAAFSSIGSDASIIVMPFGGSTLPSPPQ